MISKMEPDRWHEARRLAAEALEQPAGERDAFLDRACGEDVALRSEVSALMPDGGMPEGFMEPPEGDAASALATDSMDLMPTAAGERIGRYRLTELIAAGGMGVVYRAVRADDQYEQQVAVKIIKRGMDSADILMRFRRERQLLAQLEHPNITRLIDGGATDDGRPYLVMEYVAGIPIDQFCDAKRLNIVERLRLFRIACGAVQHAHQNLIIHRDLKPSNVLVTDEGVPKLLDFGVAKLLQGAPSSGAADPTITAMRLLTPQYASPEQIRGDPVTTASDVYSLGVILYELLSGRRPYRIPFGSRWEIERIICKLEPEKPSVRVGQSQEPSNNGPQSTPTGPAGDRGSRTASLRRRLAGDLDTIVLKAMHKDPRRRYASAEQLSEDIRRHLEGRPIMARPDTFRYRTSKFMRRNWPAVSAAVVLAMALTGGIVGTSIGMARAREARDVAAANAKRAEAESLKAQRINRFLRGMLSSADPTHGGRPGLTVREAVDRAAKRIDADLNEEPDVQAAIRATIASTYFELGLYEQAERHMRKAVELSRTSPNGPPPDLPRGISNLAAVLHKRGDLPAAESLMREALAMQRRQTGNVDAQTAHILSNLSEIVLERGDAESAEQMRREALDIQRRVCGKDSPEYATVLCSMAELLRSKGNLKEAEPMSRRALDIRVRKLGENHPDTTVSLDALSFIMKDRGEIGEAESLTRRSLAAKKRLYGEEHPEIANSTNNLAFMLHLLRADAEAEQLYREAIAMYQRGDRSEHAADPLTNLATLLSDQHRHEEAVAAAQAAVEITHGKKTTHLTNLALVCYQAGEYRRAVEAEERALELLAPGPSKTRTQGERNLALYRQAAATQPAAQTEKADK